MAACPECGADNPAEANFCLNCGHRLAPPPISADQRRRPATVLFCDVSGSTAMGERLDPEAVRELMFAYFHEMRDAIERHGGTVEKFVGDAVMAAFGVPEAHEDDALRACRSAFEMQQRVPELNRELERRFGSTLAIRIGVNTGEVVAGDPSSREAFVSGDVVNTAARLEQAASPGEVLLGAATFSAVSHAVDAEPLAPIEAKGKSEPVQVYRLLSVPPTPAPRRRRRTPLVGRERELNALQAAYEQALGTERAKLALVVGEPGVGKSRLAEEFVAAVAADARILSGRCLPYGEGITYWPLAEAVRSAVGIHDEDDRERARRRIGTTVDDERLATSLAIALGLEDGVAAPEEIAWAARRLVERLAVERPLVLHVDDVQWAEEAMLDLLTGIAERAKGRILLLCLARPELGETRPSWRPTIRLEPLDEIDARELAERLVGAANGARDRLVAASGGNPLFLEELSAMLEEEGFEGTSIPSTLEALLAARLDRLPETERVAAERASVEGQVFHRGAVLALWDGASPEVPGALRALEERQFVLAAPADFADEAAFRFRHLLIRDAAYRGLSKRLRSELHERFAGWLEGKAGERLPEVEEIVGHHLEQAYRYRVELGPTDERALDLAERAADRLAAAGARALARSDAPAAMSLLERAAHLLPPASPQRVQILPELGDAYMRGGKLEHAEAVVLEAIERAEASGNELLALSAQIQLLFSRMLTAPEGWVEEARRETERLIPRFEELGDDVALARLWHLVGMTNIMTCRFAEVQAAEERAVAHASRAGARHYEAEALDWLTAALHFGPCPVLDAIARVNEVLEGGLEHRSSTAGALIELGSLRGMLGEFDEGRRAIAEAAMIYEELGLPLQRSWPELMGGQLELLAADPVAAERHFRMGCELLEGLGERSLLSTMAGSLALSLVEQGLDDEAEHFVEVSREAGASDDILTQVLWRQARARVLARRDRLAESEELMREALALAEQTDMLNHHGNCLLDLAEVLERAGKRDEAAGAVRQALALYERKGNVVMAGRALRVLDRLRPEGRS